MKGYSSISDYGGWYGTIHAHKVMNYELAGSKTLLNFANEM